MKKATAFLLALVLLCGICGFTAPAQAAGEAETAAANALHTLGLFQGVGTNTDGTPIFDLDRAPTRNEAVTMLVRLLGKENAAKSGSWTTPFTDVADWAKPYVGYAYANGLTNGTGDTTFSGNQQITASQYLTFVLRALGYDSSKDFKWNAAWELSDQIGLTHGEYNAASTFLRGNVAAVSFAALPVAQKGSSVTLAQKLIGEGVFTQAQYDTAKAGKEETVYVFSRTNLIYPIKASELQQYLNWGYSTEPQGPNVIGGGHHWVQYDSLLFLMDPLDEGISNSDLDEAFNTGTTVSLVYSGSTAKIADNLLDGRTSVKRVELKEDVTSIGCNAFRGCSLTRIGIPSSVSYISSTAFGSSDSHKDLVIYCEKGSYAESFAKEHNISYVNATPLYSIYDSYGNGPKTILQHIMVSAEERSYYLGRGVWFSEPVTMLYSEDGRSQAVPDSQVEAYRAVGWYYGPEVYTTLYALDDRTKHVLNSQVAAEEAVGWYTFPHYITHIADQYVQTEGYNAAVEFLEWYLDSTDSDYEIYKQKYDQLLKDWQAAINCPVAILGYTVRWNSINVPEVHVTFRNLTQKTINRLDLTWTCLDAYGRATADYSGYNGQFDAYMSGETLAPGKTNTYVWTLNSNQQTSSISNYYMTGVAYTDGTHWLK